MKKTKILPFLLLPFALVGCATNSPTTSSESKNETDNSTSEVNNELIPGVTQYDLDYLGYEGKDNYMATKQGYGFEGILDDLSADSWIVAGTDKPFNVLFDSQYIDFVVDIADTSILKYEIKDISGNPTHVLTGLKTGTTKLKIYDKDENIIYRQTVNVRVKIANAKLIFEKIASADYWVGVGYGAALGNNYRLFLEDNYETGLKNLCTMTLIGASQEAGIYHYEVIESSMKELHAGPFDMFSFSINYIKETSQGAIVPLKFDISQSLSTIIVSDKQGALDMFRPIYTK